MYVSEKRTLAIRAVLKQLRGTSIKIPMIIVFLRLAEFSNCDLFNYVCVLNIGSIAVRGGSF